MAAEPEATTGGKHVVFGACLYTLRSASILRNDRRILGWGRTRAVITALGVGGRSRIRGLACALINTQEAACRETREAEDKTKAQMCGDREKSGVQRRESLPVACYFEVKFPSLQQMQTRACLERDARLQQKSQGRPASSMHCFASGRRVDSCVGAEYLNYVDSC